MRNGVFTLHQRYINYEQLHTHTHVASSTRNVAVAQINRSSVSRCERSVHDSHARALLRCGFTPHTRIQVRRRRERSVCSGRGGWAVQRTGGDRPHSCRAHTERPGRSTTVDRHLHHLGHLSARRTRARARARDRDRGVAVDFARFASRLCVCL